MKSCMFSSRRLKMSLGVRLVVGVDEILIQGSSYSPHLIPLISFLSSHSSRLISCHLISGDGRFEEIITGSPAGTVQYGTSITLWGNNLQAQVVVPKTNLTVNQASRSINQSDQVQTITITHLIGQTLPLARE